MKRTSHLSEHSVAVLCSLMGVLLVKMKK